MPKIRPLRKIDVQKRRDRNPKFIELQSSKHRVRIALENHRGLLNGVFETPIGKIIEIRYSDGAIHAYIGSRRIGWVDFNLADRYVDPLHRGQGVGSELFDIAEPDNRFETRSTQTSRKDTAAFLRKRGWKPAERIDELLLQEIEGRQLSEPVRTTHEILFRKKVGKNKFANHREWHRIKIIGRDGKIKWLTLRVLPKK